MISFEIKWEDIVQPWIQKRQNSWVFGNSFVEVFAHPILESFLLKGNGKLLLVVREKLDNFSLLETKYGEITQQQLEVENDTYESIASNVKKWPLEFLTLEIVRKENDSTDCTICLQAGVWGTAPIYLTSGEGTIAGSWNLTELYPFINTDCMDLAETIYWLSGLSGYSSRTIFKNVKLLTERAKAIFKPTDWYIEYPEPAPKYSPHFLTDSAQVTDTYREILSSSLKRWYFLKDSNLVGCELSGGLDSANVTAMAASIYDSPIATYGMILDGEMGRQQQLRRKEYTEKFNTLDYTIDAAPIQNHPLFLQGSRLRQKLINPYEEPYSELLEAMLDIAKTNDHRVILTGIGGDELLLSDSFDVDRYKENKKDKTSVFSNSFFYTTRFMHPLARILCEERLQARINFPKTIVPESALNSARYRAPVFLSKGIWPLNPLFTPELVEFCHKLPLRWRAKRYLHRQLLKELGISEATVYPKIKENFSGVMDNAIKNTSQNLVKYLLRDSSLSEMNLIDESKINQEYDSFIERISPCNSGVFYILSTFELTIKSIDGKQLYTNAG